MKSIYRTTLSISLLIYYIASAQSPTYLIQQMVDDVSKDRLMNTIKDLQNFGTRYEFTWQQDSAGSFLYKEFSNFGLQTEYDWYYLSIIALNDIDILNEDTMYIAGSNTVALYTTNGGNNWMKYNTNVVEMLYGVDFISNEIGWYVGAGGTIIKTTNSGSSWIAQNSNTTHTLYKVQFYNHLLGIVIGAGGKILRTTDGGTNWSTIASGTTQSLQYVRFVDSLNVWIVGNSGIILRSTNSGINWTAQNSGIANILYSIDFIDSLNGWIAGNGPTLLRTTNGGISWTYILIPSPIATRLRSIDFLDSLNGWAVDYYGKILKTTDGGVSWTKSYELLSSNWDPFLMKISAFGTQRVTVCGSQGVILTSTDNGANWTNQTTNLPSLFVHNSANVIATIKGSTTPEKECIIIAHYDSYSNAPFSDAPGANDNASGTSAVVEAARICKNYEFESTVKFITVSGEELGMYGSTQYASASKQQYRNIIGVVNGDMIGFPTTTDTTRLVIGSYLTKNRLIDSAIIYNQRYALGLNLVTLIDSTGASDYGPFAIGGYDAIDIAEATPSEIWGGLDPYYHKTTDTWDKLHPGLIRRGAQLMLASVAEMARPIKRISYVSSKNVIPTKFVLEQNYPNPFNPITAISYHLPAGHTGLLAISGQQSAACFVSLKIYDLLGREVATLVNERQQAGQHTISWNASKIPSGMYLYRLQAHPLDGVNSADFIETKSMLLLK